MIGKTFAPNVLNMNVLCAMAVKDSALVDPYILDVDVVGVGNLQFVRISGNRLPYELVAGVDTIWLGCVDGCWMR